ncbi:hypothetical protein BBAD15_g12055 [Beauveria bassiana D1-5]|uniref:HNH nuclease domain-containing protein n=1 Tax=Beauveria bassiana D1-5 TaxID=1245745 RepID=A0A0A2V8U9_BEABA|nr:hypothetical protein BBAD15_g12055 [Beauveria bassiana D1-5]
MSGAPTWARSAKRYGLSHRLHNAGAESIPRRVSGCPTRVPPGSVEPVVMYLDAIMLTMHVPYTLAEKRHCAGEARERETQEGKILDDEGDPLEDDNISYLEVAHILPHSLARVRSETEELSESKKTALEILNMFDNNVAHLTNGVDVDQPHNAITLTLDLHRALRISTSTARKSPTARIPMKSGHFEELDSRKCCLSQGRCTSADQSINPPAPVLLALHRAIGHILHLSGAGEHIDDIFRKLEDRMVQCDGSTLLAELVQLRMNEWNTTSVNS